MIRSMMRRGGVSPVAAATQEPLQVVGLTATASGQTTINLSWTADATPSPNGATSYEVERSVDGLGSWSGIGTVTVPTTTFSDTSLSASTTRYYRVTAFNSFGGGLPSASANATTAAVSTPTAPSGFTATSSFADSVSLAWTDNSSGSGQETGFEIEVSTNGGTSYSSVTTTAADATSYSHTGRVESQAYLYRIRATNSAGSSSWVTASSVTTPAALTGFTATASSSSAISLSWTDKSGVETGFRIERSTDNVSFSLVTTTAANAVSHSDSGLAASTLYYYRIRSNSYNGTNDSAWYSASATTQSGSSTYNVEYLVVAGGGGGGGAGGGGAGGYKTATGFSLTVGTSYTVTVGGGGAGGATGSDRGTDGSSSVFSTVTSTGGGGGGSWGGTTSGISGGSGGGQGNTPGSPGTGTAGEGNDGGTSPTSAAHLGCGGGGGADAVGGNGSNSGAGQGGNGGAGKTFYSTVYAGGGGGLGQTNAGTGGSGGGGNGRNSSGGNTAGTANRGGGGGAGYNTAGSSGGSGIVILRVPAANYSGTTTGSPTVTDDGSTKVLTFTASGSYTG